jgi:energy-coupling factor transport system permease protein
MIADITIGQFFPGNSWVHRMDPRSKILLTLLSIFILFFVKSFWGFFLFFALCATVIVVSHIPFRFIIKGLRPIALLILFTAVLNLFLTPGTPAFTWKFISISWEGIRMALFMMVRVTLLLFLSSMLMYTTSPIQLTDGIERLLAPFRKVGVPAHEIALMMTIALRFIPVLLEETDKIIKAQKARGADFESGNLVRRAKAFIPILVPLFVSAFKRAEDLATAMEARCYTGGDNRTRMHTLKYSKIDAIATVICVILFIGALVV